jgi:uncharacterized protein YdeI (YjbR/CyaY-like superfamily)
MEKANSTNGLHHEADKWRKVVATNTSWDDTGAAAALSTAAHTAYHFGAVRQILAGLKPASERDRSAAFVIFYRIGAEEMEIRKTLYVTSREEWRAWLTEHYQSETEVWLVYYKKHTGRPRISYDEAVEEALCFGWIDSIGKRIDDERFAQKFTPRRDCTNWSVLNKRRMRKLIREGRMTEAGLAKIDLATLGEEAQAKQSKGDLDIPRFVKQALMANAKAWENFRNLTPSRRRAYVQLITDAKKEETRERRLREAVSLLEQSKGELDDIPRFVKQALMARPKAWKYFQTLAPSYRRHYIGWIMHAKKEETRERRVREAVSLLEQNKKLGLK